MSETTVITGIGFITPPGDDLSQAHQALCNGQTGLRKAEPFGKPDCSTLAGEIADFDAARFLESRNLRPLNRAARLLASATGLALKESEWTEELREQHDIGLVVGTTYCSLGIISQFDCRAQREGPKYASALDFANTVLNSAAGQTAIWHNLRGCNSTVSSGNTSSLDAIAYAADMVASGKEQAMIAGGIEELSSESMVGYLGSNAHCPPGQTPIPVPLDGRRNGFVLGEAAVMFVLETETSARSRGARIIARIDGSADAFCLTPDDPDTFIASSLSAIQAAICKSQKPYDTIASISLSANGSPVYDAIEANAIKECFNGTTNSIPIQAPKSATGETLGAGGAVQLALMFESLRSGRSPGIVGFERTGRDIPLQHLTCDSQEISGTSGLINSINSDGHCHAMVVSV